MSKCKQTKKALLSSVIALILCFSMLLGTTFAWFTDSVESGINKIQAGNLDVDLQYKKVVNGVETDWADVQGEDKLFDPNALWEPGHVEVVYLKVSNLGSLALKYQLGVNVKSETIGKTEDGKDIRLSEHLVFKVVEMADPLTTYTDREAVMLAAGTEKGLKDYNGNTKALDPKGGANDEDYVALIVYMPTSVGNEANYRGVDIPTILLGVNLYATQKNAESDSFGSDYDEDAWTEGMKVYNAQDLQAAINAGETNIVVMENITLDESIVIPAPAATTFAMRATPAPIVLNLNGKTINAPLAEGSTTNHIYAIENYGNLVITGNGTINARGIFNYGNMVLESGTINAIDGNGGYAVRNYEGATFIMNGGTIATTLEDDNKVDVGGYDATTVRVDAGATFEMNGGIINNISDFTFAIDNDGTATINAGTVISVHTTVANDGNLTINGGVFTGKGVDGDTQHVIWAAAGTTTINGGTFDGKDTYNGFNVDTSEGAVVNIHGGNFLPVHSGSLYGKGTINVYGGTFFDDPSARIAGGYKAVENNGKYIVVANTIKEENVIGTAEQLKNALTNAGAAGSGDSTLILTGDIDLTNTTWTPINVDGYHGADIVTIEGNGATIKGLTAPLFAGGFAGGSGIVIKDLTIADSNIVSTNTLGSGAFIESVDSMALITLDNCHLVNSTVTGGDGSRTGGLIGWTAGYNNVNDGPVKTYVTIKDCSVIGCTITCNGSVGGIYGHAGNNAWTYSTVENCVVKDNKLNSTDDGGWRVGVVVGTANVGELTISNITESGNTLTQTGKTAPVGQSNLYGRFVPGSTGKLVIDGYSVVLDTASLSTTISNGAAKVLLSAGNYTMPEPDLRGKTLMIKGTKDAVIDVTAVDARDQFVTGATLEFDGVTLNFGKVNYMGFANTASLTYKNCQINGLQFLFGQNVTFVNCDLDSNGAEHCVWTYGVQNVSFTDCDFTYGDRGINCYSDNDVPGGKQIVNIDNCTFATTNTASEGAVEINSCFFSVGIEVNMEGCTAPAYGEMAYVSPWDSTNGAKTTINIQ